MKYRGRHFLCIRWRVHWSPGWLVLGLMLHSAAGPAAEALLVYPAQIVSNTLVHSPALQSSEKEIETMQARERQAKAQRLPQLTGDARASHYAGLEDWIFGPTQIIPAIENRYGAGVQLSQPAYTGGRLKAQRQSARFQKEAAEQTRRSHAADLTWQALSAYWNWSKAYYSLEALTAAVTRMEGHAQDMNNLLQAGLATENEKLATDVLLDQTRLRLEETKRRVEVFLARIAFLTGQAIPEGSVPARAVEPAAAPLPAEPVLLATARTNRAELAASQAEVKSAEEAIRTSRSDFYPQISLLARYESARPNLLNIPPNDEWVDDGFVGAVMSWNLFDWGLTRAKVAEARARAEQTRLQHEQTGEEIDLQVQEARINVADARERVVVAERAQASAQSNLRVATDNWHNGLARHSDVLDAHAQLTSAQSDAIAARADLVLALAALEHAIGQMHTTVGSGR
jgi:outer membrane protein